MDMYRENPIYGRKVFFLNPPFNVEKKVIEMLKTAEYEVYILKEHTHAKSVLKNFPNAICFINIDKLLTIREWYNFIKSFEDEPELKSIFLGIMASKTPKASIDKFLMNVKLPGGYIQTDSSLKPEDIYRRFSGILEINGAKGQRKYLSLTCSNMDALTGYIAYGNKLYPMSFKNISSIGITCKLPVELSSILQLNTLLNNVSLSLGRWSVITECVVYSLRVFKKDTIAILLFAKSTPKETKESIRKFIYDVLYRRLDTMLKTSAEDVVDYSVAKPSSSTDAIPDYNAPDESDSNGEEDVSELEEIDGDEKTDEKKENEGDGEKEAAPDSDKDAEKEPGKERTSETAETPVPETKAEADEEKEKTE